ncbi:MAG: GNAT family N-acetyltransferase [Microcoleaceae cyanobacterium]
MIEIRQASVADFEQIWPIFHQVVSQGDTYAFAPETTKVEAYTLWMQLPQVTYVAVQDQNVLGTYYLKPNHSGLVSHICNAGFMVAEVARGQGIGQIMGEHAIHSARHLGFKAMQFNFVVSTNKQAIKLWQKLGFEIIGIVPKGFQHRQLGFVDIFIMYQWLEG